MLREVKRQFMAWLEILFKAITSIWNYISKRKSDQEEIRRVRSLALSELKALLRILKQHNDSVQGNKWSYANFAELSYDYIWQVCENPNKYELKCLVSLLNDIRIETKKLHDKKYRQMVAKDSGDAKSARSLQQYVEELIRRLETY
jgi:hypothetical protein